MQEHTKRIGIDNNNVANYTKEAKEATLGAKASLAMKLRKNEEKPQKRQKQLQFL